MKKQIDETYDQDRRLLDLLREDARLPTAALARKLGVARTTLRRMKRRHGLER